MDDYFIHSEAELLERSIECLKFIQDYDTLYTQLLEDNSEAQGKIETKALIINEDRRHMLMPLSMAGPIDDERDRLPYERIHQVIKHTIRSNQRSGKIKQNGLLLSNMEIFKEGYFATMHNQQHQHRLSINFFENAFPFASASKFRIQINEQSYPCQVRKAKGITSIQSPFFDNLNLLENQYWEILFFQGDNIIGLNNFMFSFTETEQTYNFVEIIN